MHFTAWLFSTILLTLTVVPGLKTIARAEPAEPPAIPLTLPNCAQSELTALAAKAGCSVSSAPCMCSKKHFFPRLLAAIQTTCSASDQSAVQAFVSAYCGTDTTASHNPVVTVTATTQTTTTTFKKSEATAASATDKSSTSDDGASKTTMTTTTSKGTSSAFFASQTKKSIGGSGRVQDGIGTLATMGGIVGIGLLVA